MISTIPIVPVPTTEDGIIAQDQARMTKIKNSLHNNSYREINDSVIHDAEMRNHENSCDLSSIASLEDEDGLLSEPMDIDTSKLSEVKIEGSSIFTGAIPAPKTQLNEIDSTKTSTTSMETVPSFEDIGDTKMTEVERSKNSNAHENTRSGTANAPISSTARRGLKNLGNTCYLNSAIQMLFSLENGFVQDLFHHNENSIWNKIVEDENLTTEKKQKGKSKDIGQKELELRNALVSIGKQILNEDGILNVVNPVAVKSAIDKKAPQFVGYRQHDSHEFLSALLDILHEEVKVNNKTDSEDKQNQSSKEKTEKEVKLHEKKKAKKKKKKKGWRRLNPLFRGGKRVSSYSELDAEAISDLLHGKENNDDSTACESDALSSSAHDDIDSKPEVKSWASIVSSSSKRDVGSKTNMKPLHCTLVGGRAVAPVPSTIIECVVCTDDNDTPATSNNIALHKPEQIMNNDEIEEQLRNVPTDIHTGDDELSIIGNGVPEVDAKNESTEKILVEDKKAESKASDVPESTLQSFVDSHFCSEIRVTLTCDSCCYSRSKTEMYRYLSIDVDNEDDNSSDNNSSETTACVEEGLRRFFAPEKRDIKCEKCFCETATQTMKLIRLPNALLLHLKRFIVEFTPNYDVTYRKNQSPVEYSSNMNLSDYCAVDVSLPRYTSTEHMKLSLPNKEREEMAICSLSSPANPDVDDLDSVSTTSTEMDSLCDEKGKYSIKSVVHHIGSTASCGHYTADVLVRNAGGVQKWQRCNDCKVTSYTDENEVVTGTKFQKTAYMVMYELSL